ncbi:MAG: hypothetical protein JNK14_20505 [Chitinophagaceae bacterium]|nr:hypothetical protein [Chitinophagaceae bacterium]
MPILQIEHKVPDYDGWKKAFDSDPINRKKSGVKRYRIYRPADDDKYVVIDLELSNMEDARLALIALQNLWGKVQGKVMMDPQTRILEMVETAEL